MRGVTITIIKTCLGLKTYDLTTDIYGSNEPLHLVGRVCVCVCVCVCERERERERERKKRKKDRINPCETSPIIFC